MIQAELNLKYKPQETFSIVINVALKKKNLAYNLLRIDIIVVKEIVLFRSLSTVIFSAAA